METVRVTDTILLLFIHTYFEITPKFFRPKIVIVVKVVGTYVGGDLKDMFGMLT